MTEDPIRQEIVKSRVHLLMKQPFFGSLVSRLELVDATEWCNTAATDGRRLYYNREFIKKLEKPQLDFLLGHEVLHVVFDHFSRRGRHDPDVWNMAIDYFVNAVLVDESIGKKIDNLLLDSKYTQKWSADSIYNDLMKRSKKVEVPLDEHLEFNSNGECEKSGPKGKVIIAPGSGQDGPVHIPEDELEEIRAELKSSIIQAAQMAQQQGAGNIPASVKTLISELTDSKIDWRDLIETQIKSCIKDDFTYMKPSRRNMDSNVIMPGMNVEDTIDVSCGLDNSGSILQYQLVDFLSEVKGVMDQFSDFKLRVWFFDTRVTGYKEFTPQNIDEIYELEITGGGGTVFECNWDFMKNPEQAGFSELEPFVPEKLIIFTDGMPNNTWGDPIYCDTIFLIHENPDAEAPFGFTVHYEDNE